jgi:hypothetical protein
VDNGADVLGAVDHGDGDRLVPALPVDLGQGVQQEPVTLVEDQLLEGVEGFGHPLFAEGQVVEAAQPPCQDSARAEQVGAATSQAAIPCREPIDDATLEQASKFLQGLQ